MEFPEVKSWYFVHILGRVVPRSLIWYLGRRLRLKMSKMLFCFQRQKHGCQFPEYSGISGSLRLLILFLCKFSKKIRHSQAYGFFEKIRVKIGPERHFTRHRESAVNISRISFSIQTMHTYLNSAQLTGFNSTKNIEILQNLTILEPFYGIRNILDICP